MNARAAISTIFQKVADEQNRKLAPLSEDLNLLHCGLDSLSFALIVARLEDEFGFDPFENLESFPVTFSDFVVLYDQHSK